ncbi:hypothetical protein Tco_1190051 [Tanacetum coccineum]
MTEGRVLTDLRKILPGTTTKDRKIETGSFRTDDTNDYRELRYQIKEVVKSGQFSHLVKGIKKGKVKALDTLQGERKKGEKDTSPVKAPILMISKRDHTTKRKSLEELTPGFEEITFPHVAQVNNSSDPVIIKAKILGRQVNRVYMDSGSSCEVIYEHSFLKLKPSIKSLRVDSKVPLVSFSGYHSWPIREVPLEITIGEWTKDLREVFIDDIKWILSCTDAEERIIVNSQYPKQMVVIGKKLPANFKERLQDLLRSNADVFAWTHADMTRIPRTITVKNQMWVANPVMVKKGTEVESLSGFRLKCFLDACKGYHQIQMAEEDEDKTTFFAGQGTFCYQKMPFDLKNARATYHRLVDKVFNDQIGRNLEAYIDDMEGPFLGHLITKKGIRANPSKVKAVTDLEPPRTLKDIQSLNGKLAALSRFLSKGVEKSLPFFKTLKR